ncbi:MAG: hypothetical protein SH850_13605, partial [Planctomycetaceae bacterium]|nr:hypothetical protein [Planctomycetaceae bacterium]
LKQLNEISLSTSRNRSKPFCRRMSAEAHAIAGQLDKALGEIDQLTKVGAELPFYRVGPWVEVFWQAHAAGDVARSATALDNALADTAKLPKRGRDQMDVATRLAAALVVAGRDAEARTLIEAHQANDLDGAVSFWLMWIAADRDLKNPEALIATQPVVPRQFPQAAATSAVVTLRGEPDLARKFALGWSDLDAKAEAVSAWAEALMWSQPPAQAASAISSGLTDLPPAVVALVLARSARAAAAVGDDAVAKQLLTRAQSTLEEVKLPENYLIPARGALIKTRPQFDDTLRRAASAAAEIAVAPASLGHDRQAALDAALQYARGLGPSSPAIGSLVAAADQMGPTELRNTIKQELKLKNDDFARQAVGVYRRHLADLDEAAKQRFAVQSTIMTRAARLELGEQTWLVASSRAIDADVNLQEGYLGTEFAGWLMEAFRESKQPDLQKAVLAAIGGKTPARPVPAVYRELIAAGQFDKAWGALAQQGVRADMQEALVLEAAVTLAAKEPLSGAWSMLAPVPNVLREPALEGIALIAARNGRGGEVAKHIPNVSQATEIVAMNRGLVAGLADVAASK